MSFLDTIQSDIKSFIPQGLFGRNTTPQLSPIATSSGASQFQLAYELSPIAFVGGIAGNPSQILPITSIIQGANFVAGLLRPGENMLDTGEYFARFVLESGSTLIENQIATYPMINLTTAANAIITQPLRIAMRMICPATTKIPYPRKLSMMTGLVNSLNNHIALGGTFNVSTPAYTYQGLLLENLRDVSPQIDRANAQVQLEYVWSFMKPLIAGEQVQAALNTLMGMVNNGTQTSGDPPGSQPLINASNSSTPPNVGAIIPAASGVASGAISVGAPTVSNPGTLPTNFPVAQV